MDYDDFLKMFDPMVVATEYDFYEFHTKYRSSYHDRNKSTYDKIAPFCVHKQELVGGYSGGSCWDNSRPEPWRVEYTSVMKIKEEFVRELDEVLLKIFPNIALLQYKRLLDLIKEEEYTEQEYYGNSNDYIVYYIELKELYDLIVGWV